MTTETFFKTFHMFADAPDGVNKMRELVLDLAIQGNLLVTRDPSGWMTIRLGEIVAGGLSSVNPAEAPQQLFELWSVPSYTTRQPEILTGAEIGSTKRELPEGSILLGKINPHLNRVWKVARRTKHTLIASPEWITITPDKSWDPDYLARLLASPSFNRDLCSTAQGMGSLTRANMKKVAELEICRPPLPEQKRIVAKVDELMALCDRLEAQQQERETRHAALARASLARFADAPTPANLEYLFHPSYAIPPADLRKSILTLAVQGKLVPQDPNDEPAEELVERIRGERLRLAKTGKAAKPADFAPIADTAQPYDIPESWAWVPFGNVAFIRTGKLDANASSPDGQYPFFTCAKDPLRIDRYAYDGECVLLAGNGNFDVNYYDGKFEAYQRTYIIEGVSRDMVDGRYLFRFIQKYADTLREMSVGGVISYIKIGFLTDAPLPLPPLAEQRRIVAKVEQLMALVDALETQLAASRATAANLLTALVAELTTKD